MRRRQSGTYRTPVLDTKPDGMIRKGLAEQILQHLESRGVSNVAIARLLERNDKTIAKRHSGQSPWPTEWLLLIDAAYGTGLVALVESLQSAA